VARGLAARLRRYASNSGLRFLNAVVDIASRKYEEEKATPDRRQICDHDRRLLPRTAHATGNRGSDITLALYEVGEQVCLLLKIEDRRAEDARLRGETMQRDRSAETGRRLEMRVGGGNYMQRRKRVTNKQMSSLEHQQPGEGRGEESRTEAGEWKTSCKVVKSTDKGSKTRVWTRIGT